MHAPHRVHKAMTLYLPFYRRLVLRTALPWLVLRLFSEAGMQFLAETDPLRTAADLNAGLHPLAALALIGFVLALDAVNARATREPVFRANAGISTSSVLLTPIPVLLLMELALRSLL